MTRTGQPRSHPRRAGGGARQAPRRRRRELLDAAARVFAEKGYDAASMQDIADALGILKGSVYYYAASKEEILYDVIKEMHDSALAGVAHIPTLDIDPLTRIRLFAERHIQHAMNNLDAGKVVYSEFRCLAAGHRESILAERARYGRILYDLIERAREQGAVCPDVDPKLAHLAVLGLLNGIYTWYRPDGSHPPAAIVSAFADMAVTGLLCGEEHVPGHRAARSAAAG